MIYAISLCHCFTFYFIIEIFNCSFERCMAHFSSARSSKFEVFDNLPHSCKIVAFLISFKAKCGQKNAEPLNGIHFTKRTPYTKARYTCFASILKALICLPWLLSSFSINIDYTQLEKLRLMLRWYKNLNVVLLFKII